MAISKRVHDKELIDLGNAHYTEEEYKDCLWQLNRIGKYLGGNRATFKAFKRIKKPIQSILDVGCGNGLFTIKLAKRYPHATITGIDTSKEAIIQANNHLQNEKDLSNVAFLVPATPELQLPDKSIDVVTSTLVCHHLNEEELIEFLKKAYAVAKQAVIISDLHRHPLASYSYALIAPLFFRNRLIFHDGLLSIKRSFTYKDWIGYLNAANIPLTQCTITWNWAFRWTVLIHSLPV